MSLTGKKFIFIGLCLGACLLCACQNTNSSSVSTSETTSQLEEIVSSNTSEEVSSTSEESTTSNENVTSESGDITISTSEEDSSSVSSEELPSSNDSLIEDSEQYGEFC